MAELRFQCRWYTAYILNHYGKTALSAANYQILGTAKVAFLVDSEKD